MCSSDLPLGFAVLGGILFRLVDLFIQRNKPSFLPKEISLPTSAIKQATSKCVAFPVRRFLPSVFNTQLFASIRKSIVHHSFEMAYTLPGNDAKMLRHKRYLLNT